MAKKFKQKFAGNGVQVDGPPVNSPTGKGLVKKTTEQDNTVSSQSDKDMDDHGLLNGLGDNLYTSDAMCDVDDDGVEHKPQGVKVPGQSKPKDGYTKPLKHNLSNSIAESSPDKIAEMMDGGTAMTEEECSEGDDGEGDLTMEELLESYLEECGDTVSYEGFANHCDSEGYENPDMDDMMSSMDDNQGYMFTPVGNGLYRKEAIPQSVGIADLPGVEEVPSASVSVSATPDAVPAAPDDISSAPDDISSAPDDTEEFEIETEGTGDVARMGVPDDRYKGKAPADDKRLNENDIKSGAPMPSVDYSDGEGMEVSSAKGKTSFSTVQEDSVTTGQIAAPPSTKPMIKKQRTKKAGDASKAVKGLKSLGDTLDHKIENDDNIAEGIKLPKNIAINVSKIMEHVQKQLAKFPGSRKWTPSYRGSVDLNGKKAYTNSTVILAEAATDVEELAVIGKGNVVIEVSLMEGKEQKGMFLVQLPKLNDRKPAMVAEGMLFRFPSIAERVSKTIIRESFVHSVAHHAFGAIIKGDVEKLSKIW